jgi:TATA-box binding protein (TBP) (component of TFIID and TFIIIB)
MDTFNYILTLADIKKRHPTSSWVRITTITMISKLGQDINLETFRAKFAPMHVRVKGTTGKGFEWTMKKTTFYNQVTIGYRDQYSQKSIKLFPNGSVQVAGCSDLFDCQRILRQVAFLLERTLGVDVPVAHLIENLSVKMINTNFSLNSSVSLNKVIQRFSSQEAFRVSFDPDRYSAVKIKFVPGQGMKQVTASIFSTGKIIVTGAQKLDEIAQAYKILNENLDTGMFVKPVATPETFDTIMGAQFGEWVRVLTK